MITQKWSLPLILNTILLVTVMSTPNLVWGQFLQLKFDHITSDDGLPHSTIHGIAKDKYGFMWFGTWSGLCRYDGYSLRVYRYDPQDAKSIINNRIHNILLDGNGDLWISTFDENYVCRYNYQTDNFDWVAQNTLSAEFLNKINRRAHKLSVNFSYKKTRWHLDEPTTSVVETHLPTGKQKFYQAAVTDPWGLNDGYISDIFLDEEHVLWLGTYGNGINRSYLEATPFHNIYRHPSKLNSLVENTIRSLAKDENGNLWAGTRSKGLTLITKEGKYHQFQHNPSNVHSLQNNYIKKVFCDSKGLIWIGSQTGVDYFDPSTQVMHRIDDSLIFNTAVFSIIEDEHTNLWFGSWNGLFKYIRRTGKLIHIVPGESLPYAHVWTIFQDSKDQLWVGTEGGGIAVFNKKGENELTRVKLLQHGRNGASSLSDNRVYSILEDSQNRIWIGTGNGLDLYEPKTGTIKHLSRISELWPKGTIAGILEDDIGYIWVSHKQGISRINKMDFSLRTFTKKDGLLNSEFIEGSAYKAHGENRLYYGGNKGITYFSPDSIKTNPSPPKIVFTELRILNEPIQVNQKLNGRVVLQEPLYLQKQLNLNHRDKTISIEFAGLHFANPGGNKYAYMLEGFDQDWIYTDATKRVASYSNLAPGEYTFKVLASNSDGVWTPRPTELKLHVAPAIWASSQAYALYMLIGLGLLYAFYHYITRYTKLKSRLNYEALLYAKDRELHNNKVQFFTNISHEIKTPLSLILSPIQQLKDWHRNIPEAQDQLMTMEKNGKRLLKTVNQLLDIRRFETGKEIFHGEQLDLIALASKIINSFSQEAKQKNVQLKLDVVSPTLSFFADADKIEKVLYNLLSNALKYTAAGKMIKLRARHNTTEVRIDVIDNGIGIDNEDLDLIFKPFLQGKTAVPGGSGLGLTYSQLLIEMHGGSIGAQSRRGTKGRNLTIFTITLPIQDTTPEEQMLANRTIEFPPQVTVHATPVDLRSKLPESTLLLVEDNQEMREYLANFFRKEHAVILACDGLEGLAQARKHVPDLIISDVMMPKLDGINFVRHVKTDLLLCHIPVILLTARTLVEYEVEGLQTGADDYIVKPFHLPILALKVRNQLLLRLRMQEKFKTQIYLEPSKLDIQSPDEVLMKNVMQFVESHLADSDLKIDKICTSLGLSRAQLYRKMKALTGYSMNDFIKEVRLKRAAQLLQSKNLTISETAYTVGFNDPEYFRKSFKQKFGVSPSAFARQYNKTAPDPN